MAAALLLAGCTVEKMSVIPDEQERTEQDAPPETSDDTPGLEGMPEDGQGTIYF